MRRKVFFRWLFERFFVTLEEFAESLYIKAVWGIEDFLGYDLATVLNSTFFHLKVEVWRSLFESVALQCNLL